MSTVLGTLLKPTKSHWTRRALKLKLSSMMASPFGNRRRKARTRHKELGRGTAVVMAKLKFFTHTPVCVGLFYNPVPNSRVSSGLELIQTPGCEHPSQRAALQARVGPRTVYWKLPNASLLSGRVRIWISDAFNCSMELYILLCHSEELNCKIHF